MTEQEALIRRVCLAPDDDTPRLIFADWCDDQGEQERAEFIRVQCLLASRYPPSIDDRLHCVNPWRAGVNMVSIAGVPKGTPVVACKACETCADMKRLRHLEDELLPTVGCPFPADEWMDLYDRGNPGIHWRRKDGSQCFNCVAERGFVAEVSCDCQAWLTHGPAIVQQQPITRVVLSDRHTLNAEWRSTWSVKQWLKGPPLGWSLDPYFVPIELFRLLTKGHRDGEVWRRYDPPEEAFEDLGNAALLWARREAGLEVECTKCDGNGGHRWYLGHGNIDEAMCDECQGAGWRCAE